MALKELFDEEFFLLCVLPDLQEHFFEEDGGR